MRCFQISWLHHFSASHLNCLPVQHRSIWWIMSNGAAILSQEGSHRLPTVWNVLWMCLASSGNSYWMDAGKVQKTALGICGINVQNWNTWQHERWLKKQTRPNCLRWLFVPSIIMDFVFPLLFSHFKLQPWRDLEFLCSQTVSESYHNVTFRCDLRK